MPEEGKFNIAVYSLTDVGRVRSGNEDNFLVLNLSTADTWILHSKQEEPDEKMTTFGQSYYGSLLAVADGMGGALAGEVASRLAVECVRDRMLELQSSPTYKKFPFPERLRLSVELANIYIHQMSVKRAECAGMGATFTGLGISGDTAYFAQVGDSRAYLIRGNQIQQVTRDQSLVGQLVQAGHLTEEEAEKHSYKNVILQALGATPKVSVVIDRLQLCEMDIVVLCSDGLSNKVKAEEIRQIVDESPSLKEACEALVSLANSRGGEDNITVVVAQFSGGSLQPPDLRDETATLPLASRTGELNIGALPNAPRWGATTVPRDPNLPYEISAEMVDEEEDTLRPTDDLSRA